MATATHQPTTPSAPTSDTDSAPNRPTSRFAFPYRLSVEQYERMGRAGILGEKERVFLWKGHLVTKMTIHPAHAISIASIAALLPRVLPGGWHVRQDLPVRLADDSMPEPDLVVARGEIRDYSGRHPNPQDIALLVEVADSSLAEDRGELLREYARSGIPIYWIVNIPQRCIEVYTDPTGPTDQPTYRTLRTFGPDEQVPVILDDREVGHVVAKDVLP